VIEIPGYRVLRQLGRGGMATVYLAVQQSVDREVALKVMAPALLADADFGARFLREARIAARLHHRHVVGIHDVGRAGDYHYIAMEYLAGGTVLGTDGVSRPIPFALRVVREIAEALHYAHAKGFIHRDVKPDNILLREDGSAALTDFGIARANGMGTRMTRTGVVVGTPHYMSPEQARGKQLDGRCDIYSLGIVLYEMLVGRVPYHADDSLAVGIMHITEPVPTLPDDILALQPLISGLLAKEPGQRFQTGAEVAQAIADIERRMAEGELAELRGNPRQVLPGTPAADTFVSPLPMSRPDPDQRGRAEPNIGRIDELYSLDDADKARAHRGSARRAPRRRGALVRLLLPALFLIVAGAAAWIWQDDLRSLLPRTTLNQKLALAEQALADGRLDDPVGEGALALFEEARDLDPDSEPARRGLARTGEALVERARSALARGDQEAARTALAGARRALGGGLAVESLERDLKQAEAGSTAIATRLAEADAALAKGRILGSGGAAALYAAVLEAEPGNALAEAGITRCAEALANQAQDAIEAGDAAKADTLVADVARIAPAFPGLPDLRGALSQLRDVDAGRIEELLAQAARQMRAGRISGGDDSAAALYRSVQQLDKNNAAARKGLADVARALLVRARTAIEESDVDAAAAQLEQARAIDPQLAEIGATEVALRELRERLDIEAARPVPAEADRERVRTLVAEAEQAARDGNLIVPPGRSAYDKYRGALAIDPRDAGAQRGLAQLPARAKSLFEDAIVARTPYRARMLLDAVRQLAPGDVTITALSTRLADAFLDEAEAKLAAGRRGGAQRALDAARELSPANPRLPALTAALRPADG
jgi:hypothetical protein